MLAVAWGFLTSKFAGPAASAVALALALLLIGREAYHDGVHLADHREVATITRARDAAITERDGARRDLGTCKGNASTLQAALDTQNGAVAAVAAAGAARTAAANKALGDARTATLNAQSRIAAIMATKPGPDTCKSALDLIKGSK
jgi:hypothetical protein